jgi:hypothetical protein
MTRQAICVSPYHPRVDTAAVGLLHAPVHLLLLYLRAELLGYAAAEGGIRHVETNLKQYTVPSQVPGIVRDPSVAQPLTSRLSRQHIRTGYTDG